MKTEITIKIPLQKYLQKELTKWGTVIKVDASVKKMWITLNIPKGTTLTEINEIFHIIWDILPEAVIHHTFLICNDGSLEATFLNKISCPTEVE